MPAKLVQLAAEADVVLVYQESRRAARQLPRRFARLRWTTTARRLVAAGSRRPTQALIDVVELNARISG